MNRWHASRNPYEEAELFCMLERMRRSDELDLAMDRELGELIVAATRMGMSCAYAEGVRFDGPEAESQCMVYVLEASRKACTDNPRQFVNYLVKSLKKNWIRDSMTENNRHRLLYPVQDTDGIELAAELDGTPQGMGPWEKLRVFTIKDKEADDGRKTSGRRARGSAEGT